MTKVSGDPNAPAIVAEPREPCWAITDRIRGLRQPPAPETAPERRGCHAEMAELQQRLAVDFGRRHGWMWSERPFTAETLARGGVWDSSGRAGAYDSTFCDHPYGYRVDRRARALVAHLYDGGPDKILTWAAARGLQASFPDYPSWWYPGQTTLVLYVSVMPWLPPHPDPDGKLVAGKWSRKSKGQLDLFEGN